MSQLQIFKNEEFGEIRTVTIDSEPWLVGKDVATALGYTNSRKAIIDHVHEDDKGVTKCDTPSGAQQMTIINESGLYALIFGSKLESAKRFKRWVTAEVLPSIRKHGGYINGQERMSDEELLSRALMVAQNKIEENRRQIEEMKPHAVLGKAITEANSSILVGELAKILKQNGIDIGAKRLFAWLRENGYLIRRKGDGWNMPTQKSMELKLFEIKESVHIDTNGVNVLTRTPKLLGKDSSILSINF